MPSTLASRRLLACVDTKLVPQKRDGSISHAASHETSHHFRKSEILYRTRLASNVPRILPPSSLLFRDLHINKVVGILKSAAMSSMYKLSPLYDADFKIQCKEIMYKLPNLMQSVKTSGQTDAFEARLHAVLGRLDDFRDRINALQKATDLEGPDCKTNALQKAVVRESTTSGRTLKGTLSWEKFENSRYLIFLQSLFPLDVVVIADPSDPPLYLPILCRLLSQRLNMPVAFKIFVHSSVKSVPNHLRDSFFESSLQSEHKSSKFTISIIWKKPEDDLLPCINLGIGSGRLYAGHVAVAKFLASAAGIYPCRINSSLDRLPCDIWCQRAVSFLRFEKQRSTVLQSLDAWLAGRDTVAFSSLSVADLLLWSVLFRTHKKSGSLPSNVKRWFDCCSSLSCFSHVVTHVKAV
uniref:Thioredoxin_16 domain-containing protein n=1 Tax=Trichuris muris TaxID=70415 RepID=A0A5S6QLH1_TRIMR